MKVVLPKSERSAPTVGQPALSLVPAVEDDTGRTKMSFKLFTDPANVESPKFAFSMCVLTGAESLREHLTWKENVDKIIAGLNLDTPSKKNTSITQLVTGSALTSYQKGIKDSIASLWEVEREAAAQAIRGGQPAGRAARVEAARAAVPRPDLREQDIIAGLQSVIRDRSPYKVLETQKRYMRRDMRRPPSMPIRTFVNHLLRINDNELPFLPPFGHNQALSQDELKEILYYGLPNKWKDDMIKMNFDCFMQPFEEVVDFCERQECYSGESSCRQKGHTRNRDHGGEHE